MRVPEKQKRKNRVIGHYIYSLQLFESRFNFQRKGEREKKRLDTPQIPDPGQSGGKRVSARLLASPVYGLRRLPIFVAFLNRRVGADYREKMYVPHHRAEHVFQREPITLFFSLPSLSLFPRRWRRFRNGRWSQVYSKMERDVTQGSLGDRIKG